jgi:hypothetical protein
MTVKTDQEYRRKEAKELFTLKVRQRLNRFLDYGKQSIDVHFDQADKELKNTDITITDETLDKWFSQYMRREIEEKSAR